MENIEGLYQVVVLALATAAISVTISRAWIFASFRMWVSYHSAWLGELVSCSYCLSHWVAIVLVAIYRPVIIKHLVVIDLVVSVFVMVTLAAITGGLVTKLNPFPSRSDEIESERAKLREALKSARDKLIEQSDALKRLRR